MVGGDVAHDRQPEPGAARVTAPGLVDAVEPLEDPVDVAGGDADALVGDHDLDPTLGDARAHLDHTTVLAVLHRILHEVADRRHELALVGAHPDGLRWVDGHHLHAASGVGDPATSDRGLDDAGQVDDLVALTRRLD